MAKSDVFIVGTPHDPLSISGSDPWNASGSARLACWYNIQPGLYVTGTANSAGDETINTIFDSSQFDWSTGTRALRATDDLIPAVNSSIGSSGIEYTIGGNIDETEKSLFLKNNPVAGTDMDPGSWQVSPWISGSTSASQLKGPTSIFTTMKYNSYGTNNTRPLTVTYGTGNNGDADGNDGKYGTFSLGLWHDADASTDVKGTWVGYQKQDGTDVYKLGNFGSFDSGYHALSLVFTTASVYDPSYQIDVYHNGNWNYGEDFTNVTDANRPGHFGDKKTVSFGGYNHDWGGGKTNASGQNEIGEMFAFDDALSDTRRQQMERYLCDKYDLTMGPTYAMSTFDGGGTGISFPNSALNTQPSSSLNSYSSQYSRKFSQARPTRYDQKIHHETAGGAFWKNTAASGLLTEATGSVSLRAWVRVEDTGSSAKHGGGQVALVAHATSPWGHKMDNIKGYAMKFGTLKDGVDVDDDTVSDTHLKFRLSSRDARRQYDGSSSGFGDQDLTITDVNLSESSWYQMRMDVITSGSYVKRETLPNYRDVSVLANNTTVSASIGTAAYWNTVMGTGSADFYNGYRYMKNTYERNEMLSGNITHYDSSGRIRLTASSYWNENLRASSGGANGEFTVSTWIYNGARNTEDWPSIFKMGTNDALAIGYYKSYDRIWCGYKYQTWNNNHMYFDNSKIDYNTWNHVLVTGKAALDGADNVAPILYLNGKKLTAADTARNSNTLTWSGTQTYGGRAIFGGNISGSGIWEDGCFRNAAIWNKILDDNEAAAVYNSGSMTMPTVQSGRCIFKSALTGSTSAATYMYNDSDSQLKLGSGTNYNWWNTNTSTNNGDLTFMGWVQMQNFTEDWNCLFGGGQDSGGTRLRLYYNKSSEYFHFNIGYGGSQKNFDTAGDSVPREDLQSWCHVALVLRKAAQWDSGDDYPGDQEIKLYINGRHIPWDSKPSAPGSNLSYTNTNFNWELGIDTDNNHNARSQSFLHWGIWNEMLTSAQIQQAYNRGYIRNAFQVHSSTPKGYWALDVPNTGSSYTNFDGSGDCLKGRDMLHNGRSRPWNNKLLKPGQAINPGQFSFSGWVYSNWSGLGQSAPRIFDIGNQGCMLYWSVTNEKLEFQVAYTPDGSNTNFARWTWNWAPTNNSWHHIAISFNYGGKYSEVTAPILYVDGSSEGSGTIVGGGTDAGNNDTPNPIRNKGLRIGNNDDLNVSFTGRFKEFAFWNKVITSGNVTTLYNGGTPAGINEVKGIDYETLIAYYRLTSNFDDYSKYGESFHDWTLTPYGDAKIAGMTYPDSATNNDIVCEEIVNSTRVLGNCLDESGNQAHALPRGGAITNQKSHGNTTWYSSPVTFDAKRGSFTISAWVMPTQFGDSGGSSSTYVASTIVQMSSKDWYHNGGNYYPTSHFGIRHDGYLAYTSGNYEKDEGTGEDDIYAMRSNSQVSTGEWQHVAVTVTTGLVGNANKDNAFCEFFINGERVGSTSLNGVNNGSTDGWSFFADDPTGKSFPMIGNGCSYGKTSDWTAAHVENFYGKIGQVSLWSGRLPEGKIRTLYNTGSMGNDHLLVSGSDGRNTMEKCLGFWKMGEPQLSGVNITDEMGYNNAVTSSDGWSIEENRNGVFGYYTTVETSDGNDTLKAYYRLREDQSWTLLHEETIDALDNNFRFKKSDTKASGTFKVPDYNARYNGYYIALSSSTGDRLSTKYYIDNLEIHTDLNDDDK